MACPVCFSPLEPSVRESMNAGILVLLGVTAGVLACFVRFFVALARRARAADAMDVATHRAPSLAPSEPAV
ncbi:MAG: hypothetical protein HY824_04715 [Acidobacteria bacterium]|nr:hypothetical protein [Acidobacteriota bacterium]